MKSLCTQAENAWRRNETQRHDQRHGLNTPALAAHTREQAWHSKGESAINEEMERRVSVWNARRQMQ